MRAAVLATNAHTTQPWLFHMSPDRIDLYAALERNIGTIDSLRREMYPSGFAPGWWRQYGPVGWVPLLVVGLLALAYHRGYL